ncbi:hypothetical protein [uncultured Eubacterium sp.]|uniref:hypothetical protein n=1 Tax=Eubacterium sp. TaxID=142586 RepID=UPI003266390A
MNKTQIVEQVKEVIIKELLADVDDKHCVLDLYIKNGNKNIQRLSKVSQVFLDNKKSELSKEYDSGRILFFRKYNYEKILIQYLESKFKINDIEFDLFPSDKKERELEEKRKQEIEEKYRRDIEQKLIKQISSLKWEKTVRVSSNVYTAMDKNGKKIELHYAYGNSRKNNKANKLIYNHVPLKYVEYDMKLVIESIEKTHPKNLKADHIVMVTRSEYSKGVLNTKKQEKEDKKEAKRKKKIEEQKRYNTLLEAKEQYINELIKEYGIKRQNIENYVGYYQNRCKYMNKNIVMSCRFKDRPCTVFFSDCPHNQHFLKMMKDEQRKIQQFRSEPISIIAKRYNTTENNVKCIAGTFTNKCSYYTKGKCSYEQIPSSNCSLQNYNCKFHDEFLACMKKHSEKNLQKQKNVQSKVKTSQSEEMNTNIPVLPEIGLKDFVIRANIFKCMHNKHKIDNVVAMINIDDNGRKKQIKISAGYCSQCKIYFILDSTYQNLKKKGMILCRISDEKNYMKGGYANGIKLAQESLLMQYGYNVSQTEGLTATARQKILAVIIDNKIMSKSEIISYIDFFISQRSSNSRMDVAISKWEADRDFVENYKIGEYTQFGVNAIYR